jgi:hypothetical protein
MASTFFKKLVLQNSPQNRGFLKKGQDGSGWESPAQRFLIAPYSVISELFSLPLKGSEGNPEFAFIFVPRNGILSCFLFRGSVQNGIPKVSVPRNSRNSVGNNHFFLLFRLWRNYFFVGNSQPQFCLFQYPWKVEIFYTTCIMSKAFF